MALPLREQKMLTQEIAIVIVIIFGQTKKEFSARHSAKVEEFQVFCRSRYDGLRGGLIVIANQRGKPARDTRGQPIVLNILIGKSGSE